MGRKISERSQALGAHALTPALGRRTQVGLCELRIAPMEFSPPGLHLNSAAIITDGHKLEV